MTRWLARSHSGQFKSKLFSQLLVERRQALNHAIAFGDVENSLVALGVILEPGTSILQERARSKVSHPSILP